MIIKTEFNIGDEVWYTQGNRYPWAFQGNDYVYIEHSKITSINIEISEDFDYVPMESYTLESGQEAYSLFPSKAKLLEFLEEIKEQYKDLKIYEYS